MIINLHELIDTAIIVDGDGNLLGYIEKVEITGDAVILHLDDEGVAASGDGGDGEPVPKPSPEAPALRVHQGSKPAS